MLLILYDKYGVVISTRELQRIIKRQRSQYKTRKTKVLIIKSNKGYKKSCNILEIQRFAYEMMTTGLSMFQEGLDFLKIKEIDIS